MHVFSFCIYGEDMKYYVGLEENIRIINEHFPAHFIYIYSGKTRLDIINTWNIKYRNLVLIDTNHNGPINTLYRYKPLLDPEIDQCIIRDADSRIHERDRWCILDFIQDSQYAPYICQIIRDHVWHRSRIMGGLSLFRLDETIDANLVHRLREALHTLFSNYDAMTNTSMMEYGIDEAVLADAVYPIIEKQYIVYSSISVYHDELYKIIDFVNDGTNFCGNVVDYTQIDGKSTPVYKFNYFDFNLKDQLQWLCSQSQHDIMLKVIADYECVKPIDYDIAASVLDYKYIAHFYNKNLVECMNVCKQYYKYTITDHMKQNMVYIYNLARKMGYRILGTCDTRIQPKDKEWMVYFGNYPDDYMSYPQSNQIYRHVMFKDDVVLDGFISNSCWDPIKKIYIMSIENEFERVNETIIQLSLMNAPLDRIHVYRGKKCSRQEIYTEVTDRKSVV